MAAELAFKDAAAAEYDRAFAHVTAHFMPFLLRAAHVAPGMQILDIATGTGLSARAALAGVGPTGHVTAADISPAMAEKARQRLDQAPNALVSVEDGQALSFPDRSFDAVLCSLGLMFFPDPVRGLSEFRRVLRPNLFGVDQLNPICPRRDVEAAGLTEVEEYRPGTVQKAEDPQQPVGGDEVKIGHAASEQWVSLAEIAVDVETGHHQPRTACAARPSRGAQRWCRAVPSYGHLRDEERDCVAQHAGSDRVALALVGIQEAFRRRSLDHLGKLRSQVYRVLHTDVEPLSAGRRADVLFGYQDPHNRRGKPRA